MRYKVVDEKYVEHEFKVGGRRVRYLLDSAWTTKKEAEEARYVRRRAGDLARIRPIHELRGNLVLLAYAVYFNPRLSMEIISTHLSDGSFIRISFYDNHYDFLRGSIEPLLAPEIHDRLTRHEAYSMFENALRNDVLEKEE